MSPNTVKELQNDLRNQQRLVRESNAVLRKINKLHEILSDASIESLERDTEEQTQKLRSLYEEAKKLAEDEERTCNSCLEKLDTLLAERPKKRLAGSLGQEKRRRIEQFDGDTARGPRTGDGIGGVIATGVQVVAKIPASKGQSAIWILARVVGYQPDKDKYEVEDEDPGDEFEPNPVRKLHVLPGRSLVRVQPEGTDFLTEPEFPKDSNVLAMFPKTTSFYCAVVVAGPRKRKAPEYTLKFEDDFEENGVAKRVIDARYVVVDPAYRGDV